VTSFHQVFQFYVCHIFLVHARYSLGPVCLAVGDEVWWVEVE
jgi:hypothetical protein